MSVRLGKVFDPYIKLYLQLCGEKEESTKIVLRPSGSATDTFQEGKAYMFSVEMPNIGKVQTNNKHQYMFSFLAALTTVTCYIVLPVYQIQKLQRAQNLVARRTVG